ncbi:replicative DNA helicase [Nocardioides sp. AN3]
MVPRAGGGTKGGELMSADVIPLPVAANEAEISLLGAAMLGCPDLDDLLELVDPDDFYHPQRGEVWSIIGRLHRSGIAPDLVAVTKAVLDAKIRGVDGADLAHWLRASPMVTSAPYYAELVIDASGRRNLQRAAVRVQDIAGDPGMNLAEAREAARQSVDDATVGKQVSKARMLADLLPDVLDVAENGTEEAISTPWPDIDRYIGGIGPGRLIVIGARPGVGKSLAGTNLALHVAHHHKHAVVLASLEMPEREVGQRLLAAHATVGLRGIQTGQTPPSEWDKINQKYAEINEMPIAVDDTPGLTVAGIRSLARDMQRRRDDLALIVVDYLQLVRPAERRANRAEEVAEISRGLKLLARETGACVVAMAQLNREGAKREKPALTDLRESGAIEADADQVLLMHRPDDDTPEVEVLVEKNRHGPRGPARLQVAGGYAQLRSIEWSPTRGMA